MITGRASVVRDRYGVSLYVAVPKSVTELVRSIPGTEYDHDLHRYLVPVAREGELRAALAGLVTSWAEDTRTVRRCAVCREPLAQALVNLGERVHLGCRLPDVQHDDEPEPAGLW